MIAGILIAFLIGFLFGLKGKLKWLKKYKSVLLSTVFLLFFMGYEIGNNDALVSQIKEIGVYALYIAIFSILGSVLFTSFYEKFFKKEK